jgi:cytosine/adenosine deaminase-related metal-dependent hydrolase
LSSIGVAPTKSTAKIASDFKRPDGLTVIYPDQLQKFLENATNNGAKVLRIFNQTGTIEPDKQKDILNLSANRIEDIEYIGRIDVVISNGSGRKLR